jgi:acetyl-CoA acetyltransferase
VTRIKEAWIVGAVRTPVGRHGGALSAVRPDVRYGLATMCIGVGQGIVMVVERGR